MATPLLQTKLHVPPLRPELVPRPRLVERLNAGLGRNHGFAHNINCWANIIAAARWFLFNLVGLPTYPGHYDKFLLAVSMVFNLVAIWYAWKWV